MTQERQPDQVTKKARGKKGLKQLRNPPWTIEELPAGRWLFTHPLGRFVLRQTGPTAYVLDAQGPGSGLVKPVEFTGCFCGSVGYVLRIAMAHLDGRRAEWGSNHRCKPLWWEKKKEG